MSKLILKSPYFKPGGGSSDYAKYIATREGVEKLPQIRSEQPATRKQQELIAKILRDYPDAKDSFEYEDLLKESTARNASCFINMALESNWLSASSSEIYAKYIATRPGAEKRGPHGLFGDQENIDLDTVMQTLKSYNGRVWTHIISLRREDAARLGYDNAAAWRHLLLEHRNTIAKAMQIEPVDFHWYAAYHDADAHPHIHMMVWSEKSSKGFLDVAGIRCIRSALTNAIFKNELQHLYAQKSASRDALVKEARSAMAKLIAEMRSGFCDSPAVSAGISALAEQLKAENGKMQYGYLKPRLRVMVDGIVDELERISTVSECYEKWRELQGSVRSYYTGEALPKLPLSKQKEFKSIKNAVIREAVNAANGVFTFEDEDADDASEQPVDDAPAESPLPLDTAEAAEPPPSGTAPYKGEVYIDWTEDYKTALEYLYGTDEAEPDLGNAFALMTAEAEYGNALAMHDLARMYANGLGCDADADAAYEWYAKALSAFLSCEKRKAWKYTQYRIGKMYAAGLGTEQDYTAAAEWFGMAAAQKHKYAQYSLAGLYYNGHGVEQDYERAFELYSASAERGFPYADYELAKMYRDGIGTDLNALKAAEHFAMAFSGFVILEKRSRDDKLQYRIGQMLLTGTGTEKDIARATEYFEKSARLGNPFAQYQLAKLYLADELASPQKIEQALHWLEQSAENENEFAQYALGKLYRGGAHVTMDERRALELFTRAAKQGNEYAAYALGKLYLASETLERNVPEAVRWLGKAAELGNQFAQYRLGKLYLTGEDVPKDIAQAVSYLTDSAEQDNQYAQYALGKLYLLGRDVPRDKETALRWLERSAAQGNIYAQFFIDHADDHTEPSALLSASRLLYHLSNVFRDNTVPPGNGKGIFIDSKRRRKLREMKIAAGHAEDEQDSEYTQIMSY